MTTAWYLQSGADHDTHHGELRADGVVVARCGVTFVPRPLPFDRLALPGYPQDPDQICPDCNKGSRSTGRKSGRNGRHRPPLS